MRIDLHCHSKYSGDNHLEPENVVHLARERGLDGVCFTEHYSFDSSWPIENISVPPGFLIFRGVEVSTDCGHLLVYGVEDDSWNRWGRNLHLNVTKVIQSVHAVGGICVPAHPFRGYESLGEKILTLHDIDAVETHNGVNDQEQNQLAIQAALKLGLPSTGGSDCHQPYAVGRGFTEFYNSVSNMKDVIREIKAGNCQGRIF
jgi:predicted metal-dependent phosphoesterase TrpH